MAQDRQRARDTKRGRQLTRSDRRREQIADARTPEAALSMAFDWMRSSATRLSKPTTRSGVQGNRPRAEEIMRTVTDYLVRVAADTDREGDAQ